MATFFDFRDGSGGRMLRTLGVDISKLQTWVEYTEAMLAMPDIEAFIGRVRERTNACSSSQLAVIGAILYGMDYAWLADELLGGEFWQRTSKFDRYTATTIAAAIMRMDASE